MWASGSTSSFDVDVHDVDMFDTDVASIATLHTRGQRVLCHIHVGA